MAKNKFSYVGKYADGGSQNSFYKVKNTKYGFKSFPNKSLATFAHKVQSVLSQDILAPKVFSPVCRIRIPNFFMGRGGKTETHMILSDWGYLTEIALPFRCKSDDYCDGDCAHNTGCVHHDTICNLIDDIGGCGLDYIDAHEYNLGYVKRGKNKFLVVIDVGAESISPQDDEDYYPEVCWDGSEDMECCCEQCRSKYAYA